MRLIRELWTDGSVYPNPGFGGWAVVDHNQELIADGHATLTTNIAMEGMAILAAINHLNDFGGVIWTDSEFWVKAMNEWAPRWEEGGWIKPLNNAPLAKLMWDTLNRYEDVKLDWVRGHNGDPGNEAADNFAGVARIRGYKEHLREQEKV